MNQSNTIYPQETAPPQLPFSLEAEQSVLGAILVDSSSLPEVLDLLKPESFYRNENKQLFGIMVELFVAGQVVDHITVLEKVINNQVFHDDSDARIYIAGLIDIVPSVRNVSAYAEIVREKHYMRSLIEAAYDIIEDSKNSGNHPTTMLDAAEQKIYNIRQGKDVDSLKRIDTIILSIYDRLQKISGDDKEAYLGIPTGFGGLDRMLTGLNRSDLVLVAARPGMGKTSFALNIATNVATNSDAHVAIFSLEMSREQLVERLLSGDALIQGSKMRIGELDTEDWIKLATSAQKFSKSNIYIDDSGGITVPEMKAKLRRMPKLDLVIIDYLQLMNGITRSDNRVTVISEITRSLKIMAKDLNVPIMVLSQLSRGPESRTDHRPLLSDLRDSGSIEQDADSVLMLYRDAYYNRESEEQNVAECIVSKNRHGETGTVKLAWDGAHTKFSSLEIYRYEE